MFSVANIYEDRRARVLGKMASSGLDRILITDPLSIFYLTGTYVQPFERLYALYLSRDGDSRFFLNKLFNVHQQDIAETWMSDTDDGVGILSSFIPGNGILGVDKSIPARFLLPLMEKHPDLRMVLASQFVDDVRAVKDMYERDRMRESSKINDLCMNHIYFSIREGKTEIEIAQAILDFYKEHGSEGPSFDPIVSFGANAADPHHEPDSTELKEGDCIVIDIGCKLDGYCSDMTRTWFCRRTDPDNLKIHQIVNRAGSFAESIIKPGVRFCDIDKAARDIISAEGYGEYFTHRLGHSIGLQEHECDDVSEANTREVVPGNIFSIEPGIYIPGKVGVRIEDLVLVTEDGCEVLNKAYRGYKFTS